MVIISPIPGQEEENAEFLEQHGVGIWIKKNHNAKEILIDLLSNEQKLNQMHEKSLNLGKRNSTKNICEIFFNS